MRHTALWFLLMLAAVILLLAATRHEEALFVISVVGYAGALIAWRQHVNRGAVLLSVAGATVALVLAAGIYLIARV